jgi:hypothetical protein
MKRYSAHYQEKILKTATPMQLQSLKDTEMLLEVELIDLMRESILLKMKRNGKLDALNKNTSWWSGVGWFSVSLL